MSVFSVINSDTEMLVLVQPESQLNVCLAHIITVREKKDNHGRGGKDEERWHVKITQLLIDVTDLKWFIKF